LDILKKSFRLPLLVIGLLTFSIVLFYSTGILNKKLIIREKTTDEISFGLPVALIIPSINVNSKIQYLGITSKGEMEVPNNINDVGWFKFGSRPGEKGSAVIAGHFNGENNQEGVFANLDKLKVGDKLSVVDDKGITTSFTVREIRTYSPGFAEEVFSSNDAPHLNLITCDGLWDGAKKSYDKRLVIFSDILK